MKIQMLFLLLILNLRVLTAAEKPNIIVIFTDDQTYPAIGYNNPLVKTPHLDALASEGLIFDKAIVASPICAASRAAMMSGVFPQQNGVVGLKSKAFKEYKNGGARADQTLPNHLKKAGYHCAFWGKSHLGDPKKYGFDEGKETGPFDDTETFELAESFLNRAAKDGSKSFFLWLGIRQPHVPLKPKQKWLDLYDETAFKMSPNFRKAPLDLSINNQGTREKPFYRGSDYRNNWRNVPVGPPRTEDTVRLFMKAYYATISHMDQQIGQLVDHLAELGLKDNTVIIFLSDNGFLLGNHGLGNKITMHEESVRVPMFIHWHRLKAKGKKTDALVSSLDVYPTIVELAGLEQPDHVMGKSLVPLFNNPSLKIRDVVYSECVGVGGKIGEGHRMARTNTMKFVLSMSDEAFMFDLIKDPFELNNLAFSVERKKELEEMRSDLAKWMKEIGDRKF
jgi:arylsulfatase A-like enzyme